MINEKIKTDILLMLYRAWFSGPSSILTLPEMAQALSLEPRIVSTYLRFLVEDWDVQRCHKTDDPTETDAYYLLGCGIDVAEEVLKEDPSPENAEILRKNGAIRKALLEIVQELREECSLPHGSRLEMGTEYRTAYYRKIESKKLDKQSADRNFYYLTNTHHITLDSKILGGDFYYEVSGSGHELLVKYKEQEDLVIEHRRRVASFEALKSGLSLTPQARGHALEKLLQPILEDEGWHCELNVKTPSQENDLIIHQGREYIIVECKWEEGKKASPEYVSRLRDKVTDRPGFRTGILISMSGFSESVTDSVRHRLSSCMIILYSGQDIEDIVYARKRFTTILDERFHAAMSRMEIIIGDSVGYSKPKTGKNKKL